MGKNKKNLLEILNESDPRLHAPNSIIQSTEGGAFTALLTLAQDMIHTMKSVRGVGLAAPQIGQNIQMAVAVVDKVPVVIINPVILSKAEETIAIKEGCLSCPGRDVRILRPAWIEVKYNSINGKENIRLFGQMNSIIVSHELDHLNGKLIIDHANTPE